MGQRVAKQKEIESECDPVGNQDWENVSVELINAFVSRGDGVFN
jgi:hypothetical protein